MLPLLLLNLGGASFSNDEAGYAFKIGFSWEHLWRMLSKDNYPPLYFTLLKSWADVFGISEWSLRLTSTPFAIGTVIVMHEWLAPRLPRPVARLVILMIAFSPMLLFLARLGKYFALFTFLVVLATADLWRLLEKNRVEERWFALALKLRWGATMLTLIFCHYLGAVLWIAMGLWLLLGWWRGDRRAGALLLWLMLFAMLYIPQLPFLLNRLLLGDIREVLRIDPSPLRRLVIQSAYTVHAFTLGHTLEAGWLLPSLIAGVLGLAALATGLRRAEPLVRYAAFLALTMSFTSIAIMWWFLKEVPDLLVCERVSFALPLLAIPAAAGAMNWALIYRRITASIFAILIAWSTFNMITVRENNSWDYLTPWRRIDILIHEQKMGRTAVISDSTQFGSIGWYYLRNSGDTFIETRRESDAAKLRTLPLRLRREYDCAVLMTGTRDTSAGREITRLLASMEQRWGAPALEKRFVFDSATMRTLKQLVRRGTGVVTEDGKIVVRIYIAPVEVKLPGNPSEI